MFFFYIVRITRVCWFVITTVEKCVYICIPIYTTVVANTPKYHAADKHDIPPSYLAKQSCSSPYKWWSLTREANVAIFHMTRDRTTDILSTARPLKCKFTSQNIVKFMKRQIIRNKKAKLVYLICTFSCNWD